VLTDDRIEFFFFLISDDRIEFFILFFLISDDRIEYFFLMSDDRIEYFFLISDDTIEYIKAVCLFRSKLRHPKKERKIEWLRQRLSY
jgi:hypothetical protein